MNSRKVSIPVEPTHRAPTLDATRSGIGYKEHASVHSNRQPQGEPRETLPMNSWKVSIPGEPTHREPTRDSSPDGSGDIYSARVGSFRQPLAGVFPSHAPGVGSRMNASLTTSGVTESVLYVDDL